MPEILDRSWKNVRVALVCDDKPQQLPDLTIAFPTYHWQIKMAGLRSDGLVCESIGILKKDEATPQNIAAGLIQVSRFLETYLNCACLPNQPCAQHSGVPPSRRAM